MDQAVLGQIREDVAYCRAKIEAHNSFVERLIRLEEQLAATQGLQGERISKLEGYAKFAFITAPVVVGAATAAVTALLS